MNRVSEVINIFFSSTSSNDTFNRKDVFDNTCKSFELTRNVKIHTIDWRENIAGGLGDDSQGVIDEAVKGKYDFYFGCLGSKYGPGTIHEYEKAIASHIANGDPSHMLFGFDETPVNPFSIDPKFQLVRQFRSDIEKNKKYGKAMLYFTFSSEKEFQNQILLNLTKVADALQSRIRGGAKIR